MKYSIFSLLFPVLAAAVGGNPDPSFDPATSKGTLPPFAAPARAPAANAVGAPTTISASTAKALQAACDSWSADTGKVSGFQDAGNGLAGQQFKAAANVAFVAEVDELTHKAILDNAIGLDPQVSIANLTLTNGCFQSVVNNLQVMSVQGEAGLSLIDTINNIRCTQILPSIDTYMAVAAQLIGPGATLRKAIRPAACAAIVAAAPASAFPNVPNVPGGTPLGQQAPAADGNGATAGNGATTGSTAPAGNGATAGTGATGTTAGTRGGRGGKGTAGTGSPAAAASSVVAVGTAATPSGAAGATAGTAGSTGTTGITPTTGNTGKKAKRSKGTAASARRSPLQAVGKSTVPVKKAKRVARAAKGAAATAAAARRSISFSV
jgi:hypothetical protein